ncbi:divergent polysaccharide deacetylase family protein [Nitratidesulfovibrio sp. SRB-5]|uniref:divergent polysaccharide deacetylase family protein n=1 Tax=Nitratidesulfovibrio sp. SRB-5 TaxID=2872636 RepID=UPI0010259458|nr:divergent polysaccharide deacetylase family protein [Nitratidesulfovibrio sp. SRB-5]MBZ2171333.1 divergent polysaccharide deacetylase family protein [Nitratidesulfovibrio sp. SRB-5]RXF76858.1 divergent polysaccharide deacetylase family protein [Desulfovibrio sp. DS-1]
MAGEKTPGKKPPRKDDAKGGTGRKPAQSGQSDKSGKSGKSGKPSGTSGSRRSGGKRGKPTLTPLVARAVLAICVAATLLVMLLFVFGSPVKQFTDSGARKPAVAEKSDRKPQAPQPGQKPQKGEPKRGEQAELPQLPQFPQLPQTPVGDAPRGEAATDQAKGDADADASQPAQPERAANGKPAPADTGGADGEVRQPVTPGNLPYEETLDAPVEAGVKQVDYALVQTVTRLGLGRDRLRLASIENRQAKGQTFHFQRMEMRLDGAPDRFVQTLKETLAAWSDTANVEQRADDLLIVTVDGLPTHEISLLLYEGAPPPVAVAPGGARLAIVIDDIGESMSAARDLAALDYPVTFSVWPRSTHAREAAELAHKARREVMIHLPMEPVRYPQVKPGPGAILSGQQPQEMAALVRDAVRRVPYAVGLNNHMGSRATQNAAAMRTVCEALDGTGMFVLDSMTHPASKLYFEAKRAGLPAYKRNVFLDVIADKRNIMFQLDKAARIAQAEGQAIAIGHPLPETVAALKEWARTRDRTVTIVTVRQLVH